VTVNLEVISESKPAGIRCPTHMTLEIEGDLATATLLVR
jgi:hypothetical protein